MADIQFSTMAKSLYRSEIRELLKLTRQPDTISFGGGLPDPAIFPYQAVEEASLKVIREKGRLALQYSPTEGEPFLKKQLIDYMERQGESVRAENMVVAASSQQGLDLLAKIFIDPGDPIIVEKPTYIGAIQAFRAFRADFQGVEMDFDGVIPDELEKTVLRLLEAGRKPKFVYLIPDFQNPSGITLSYERRVRILELASKYDLIIIEDTPYRELRFQGENIPSLFSLDKEERVIMMKTFSKIFSPGFRIGWIMGPSLAIDKLVMAKQGTDLCTSAYISFLAAYLLEARQVDRQVVLSRGLYKVKRSIMLSALERFMPPDEGISWSKPEGGMFLWLELPEYIDTLELLKEAVENKVAFVIGKGFFTDGSGGNAMRLNFSFPTEKQIVEGIERIAQLVSKRLRVPVMR
ncbi:MAG: PLP-dependent aminotransferase family protein [Candidatus Zixiibacteriota bacterium]